MSHAHVHPTEGLEPRVVLISKLVGPVSLFTTNDEQMLFFSPQGSGFKVEGGEKERLFLLVLVKLCYFFL